MAVVHLNGLDRTRDRLTKMLTGVDADFAKQTAKQLDAAVRDALGGRDLKAVDGKRRVAQNPITHGLRTVSPVLPGEDPQAWKRFEAAVIADLRQAGALEAELAGRVATLLWRLRRVITFEVAAAVNPPDPDPAQPPRFDVVDRSLLPQLRRQLADAEAAVADARRLHALVPALTAAGDDERVSPDDAVFLLTEAADTVEFARPRVPTTFDETGNLLAAPRTDPLDGTDPEFLTGLGVPAEFADEPTGWDGWTGGRVRAGFETLGAVKGWTTADLYRELLRADFACLDRQVADARAAADQAAAVAGGPTAIPSDAALGGDPAVRAAPVEATVADVGATGEGAAAAAAVTA